MKLDKLFEWLLEHGGFGTIFGLIMGFMVLKLWMRCNQLEDDRARLVHEVRLMQNQIDTAIRIAERDRQEMMRKIDDLSRGG